MDSSNASPDANISVFASPDSETEPSKEEKIRTSVSVSSLAEKFEKSGEFPKSEEKTSTESGLGPESQIEINSIAEKMLKCKSDVAESNSLASRKLTSNGISHTSETANKKIVGENGALGYLQSSEVANEVKEIKKCEDFQPSVSGTDSNGGEKDKFEIYTDPKISKAVEERVAYFAEKIYKSKESSMSSAATNGNSNAMARVNVESFSNESNSKVNGEEKRMTLKEMEQSFICALKMVNSKEGGAETAATLPVPSIQITEASDREDNGSEDNDETESVVDKKEAKTSVPNEIEDSEKKNVHQPTSSTSSLSELEMKDGSEVSAEEHKATFYISDVPPSPTKESTNDTTVLRHQRKNEDQPTEPVTLENNKLKRHSSFCSKTVLGATFLTSFVTAIFGFLLFDLAREGKVPDYCSHLGLVAAVLSGIVGAFACFCYTCLESLPEPKLPGYEWTNAAEKSQTSNEIGNADVENIDGSQSSEKLEPMNQNDVLTCSKGTSVKCSQSETLLIRWSDYRELVGETQLLINDAKIHTSKLELLEQKMAKYLQ